MFCPFCGVKNDAGLQQCFVCGKKLPALDAEQPIAAKARPVNAPRPTAPAAVPARLGDRLIAVVLDTVLLCAFLLPAAAAVASRWQRIDQSQYTLSTFVAAAALAVALLIFIYYWVLEGAFGATIGKSIVGLRVARRGAQAVAAGFKSSAIRNAFRLIDGLPLYFPGFFVAVFSSKRQRLGDYAAQTVVVEQSLHWGRRAAVVALWIALIAGSVWGAIALSPDWIRAALPGV